MEAKTCSTVGCDREVYCKEVCRKCYFKAYRQKPDQVAKRKQHHKEHYQKRKDWYQTRNWIYCKLERSKMNSLITAWKKRNPEKVRETGRKHREKHPEMYNAKSAWRRAAALQATPPWVDKEALKEIYRNRPAGHHVDHIVPLQGENVTGLHVPWNLQYLTAEENLRKSNKYVG